MNHITSAIILMIDNDSEFLEYWVSRAFAIYESSEANQDFTKRENAILQLTTELTLQYEKRIDRTCNRISINEFEKTLLTSAFGLIDWSEIAKYMLSKAIEYWEYIRRL